MINRQKILLKFIQIHINVDWECISNNYALSENFMREFQDKINWNIISAYYHKLSENFIIEFQDKVYRRVILEYQDLSENFKKEFKHKIKW